MLSGAVRSRADLPGGPAGDGGAVTPGPGGLAGFGHWCELGGASLEARDLASGLAGAGGAVDTGAVGPKETQQNMNKPTN